MNDVKYRAWDYKRKRMVKVLAIDWEHQTINCEADINHEGMSGFERLYRQPLENFELLQYTGVKDKNGTEIYEGDILKNSFGSLYEVKWVSSMTSFMCSPLKVVYEVRHLDNLDTEVVGNVFENTELLRGDDEYEV